MIDGSLVFVKLSIQYCRLHGWNCKFDSVNRGVYSIAGSTRTFQNCVKFSFLHICENLYMAVGHDLDAARTMTQLISATLRRFIFVFFPFFISSERFLCAYYMITNRKVCDPSCVFNTHCISLMHWLMKEVLRNAHGPCLACQLLHFVSFTACLWCIAFHVVSRFDVQDY